MRDWSYKMQTGKLITEFQAALNADGGSFIDESTGEKNYYIEGIFGQANKRNGNGRLYMNDVIAEQVDAFQPKIKMGNAYGEADHPTSATVSWKNASHRITKLWMEGDNMMGKAIILPEGHGKTIIAAIKTGGSIPVSTRGVGSLMEGNIINNKSRFKLITVDAVIDPSGPDCFTNGILEGVEFYLEGGDFKTMKIDEQFQRSLRDNADRIVRESSKFDKRTQSALIFDAINKHIRNL